MILEENKGLKRVNLKNGVVGHQIANGPIYLLNSLIGPEVHSNSKGLVHQLGRTIRLPLRAPTAEDTGKLVVGASQIKDYYTKFEIGQFLRSGGWIFPSVELDRSGFYMGSGDDKFEENQVTRSLFGGELAAEMDRALQDSGFFGTFYICPGNQDKNECSASLSMDLSKGRLLFKMFPKDETSLSGVIPVLDDAREYFLDKVHVASTILNSYGTERQGEELEVLRDTGLVLSDKFYMPRN
ncbi:MAG: hypothetical protein CL811_01255 [Colwelliaceae bacterium]|nr:hypothetical protein [Colwelliaceae bacterium]|tara:strand:+ start:709 stop:1428 length:720 start_codon:yes stop_codon:yes gene_type:complete